MFAFLIRLARRLLWPSLMLGVIVAYGVIGYMLLERWSFLDALYMTLITVTTVGYREVAPLDRQAMIFTMSLILLGVGTMLTAVSVVAGWVAEEAVGEKGRKRRMERQVKRLSDHFIVCAYGRVGRAVARELSAAGQPFLVMDTREELEDQMQDDGVTYLIGDSAQEQNLVKAGLQRARALVCAVDSDATNVYITLVARSLKPDIFIVARASAPDSAERLYKAGADRVISPYVTSGRHMAMLAMHPPVVDYLEIPAGDSAPLRLQEIKVDVESGLINETVAQVSADAIPLAIRHMDGRVDAHPPADCKLLDGDLLILLGEQGAVQEG